MSSGSSAGSGVFAGGWTLQSAEAVCGQLTGELPVLDGLAALVEHSLVQVQVGGEAADASRFRLLETIREHALERLAASDDAAAARGQHAAAFLALAEVAEPYVARPTAGRGYTAWTWSLTTSAPCSLGV